jgi:hypothetical protein
MQKKMGWLPDGVTFPHQQNAVKSYYIQKIKALFKRAIAQKKAYEMPECALRLFRRGTDGVKNLFRAPVCSW